MFSELMAVSPCRCMAASQRLGAQTLGPTRNTISVAHQAGLVRLAARPVKPRFAREQPHWRNSRAQRQDVLAPDDRPRSCSRFRTGVAARMGPAKRRPQLLMLLPKSVLAFGRSVAFAAARSW